MKIFVCFLAKIANHVDIKIYHKFSNQYCRNANKNIKLSFKKNEIVRFVAPPTWKTHFQFT